MQARDGRREEEVDGRARGRGMGGVEAYHAAVYQVPPRRRPARPRAPRGRFAVPWISRFFSEAAVG